MTERPIGFHVSQVMNVTAWPLTLQLTQLGYTVSRASNILDLSIRERLENQSLTDVRSTGAGIKCLHCKMLLVCQHF